MKGTHEYEADSRIGIDSARSLLKGNGRTLCSLDVRLKQRGMDTKRSEQDSTRSEHSAQGDPKIEQGHTR